MVVRFGAWKWLFGAALVAAACGGKASDPRDGAAAGAPARGGSSAAGAPPVIAGSAGAIVPQGGAGSSGGDAADAEAGAVSEAGSAGEGGGEPEIPWPIPPADPLSQAVTLQIDPAHSGYQAKDTLRLPLEKRWEHPFPVHGGLGYPVIARGRVFVSYTSLNGLYVDALAVETGELIWSKLVSKADASGRANLAYQDERVFAVSGYGLVVALDSANGEEVWRAQPTKGTNSVHGTPTAVNRVLYVPTDVALFALTGTSGRVLWSSPNTCVSCSATIVNGNVHLGWANPWMLVPDRYMLTIDGMTGESLGHPGSPPNSDRFTVVAGNDRLFLCEGDQISSFVGEMKQLAWSVPCGAMPIVAADGWLFAAGKGEVAGVSLANPTVDKWSYPLPASAAPIVVGSTLVFVSGTKVVALDRATGSVQSSIDLDYPYSFATQQFFQGDRPLTGLAAAENRLFVAMPDRLVAY